MGEAKDGEKRKLKKEKTRKRKRRRGREVQGLKWVRKKIGKMKIRERK